MDQQRQRQEFVMSRNEDFPHHSPSSSLLRRRGQKKNVLDITASPLPQVQRRNSTHRRRSRRGRPSASPQHATVIGCVGSNLFDGATIDASSDSIAISSDNDEYGSQDSPEKRFPTSPLMGAFVRKTSRDRSNQYLEGSSVNGKGSNITAISDVLLNTVAAAERSSDANCYERISSSRTTKRKNARPSITERRQGIIIQALLFVLFMCGAYIINGIIMQPGEGVHEELRKKIRPGNGKSESESRTERHAIYQHPNFEIYGMHEEQLSYLQSQVGSLRNTMQALAARQLADAYFGGNFKSPGETVEVKVELGGLLMGNAFVVQVSHAELPYATWVFLRELSIGDWILRSRDQWLEIVTAPSQSKVGRHIRQSLSPSSAEQSKRPQTYESFDHLEHSIDVDKTFVVGMRNPKEGEVGVIISIYKERGMCGNYDNEVCFGKIINGFSSLNAVTELGKVIPLRFVSPESQ